MFCSLPNSTLPFSTSLFLNQLCLATAPLFLRQWTFFCTHWGNLWCFIFHYHPCAPSPVDEYRGQKAACAGNICKTSAWCHRWVAQELQSRATSKPRKARTESGKGVITTCNVVPSPPNHREDFRAEGRFSVAKREWRMWMGPQKSKQDIGEQGMNSIMSNTCQPAFSCPQCRFQRPWDLLVPSDLLVTREQVPIFQLLAIPPPHYTTYYFQSPGTPSAGQRWIAK